MKADIKVFGSGNYVLTLRPETDAERLILHKVADFRELTCADLLDMNYRFSADKAQRLEIMPIPGGFKLGEEPAK